MRKTIILTVEQELADFMQSLPVLVDPSALINQLFHEDMREKGIQIDQHVKQRIEQDKVLQAIELLMDEDTHAAG